jgi:hypothetical protein
LSLTFSNVFRQFTFCHLTRSREWVKTNCVSKNNQPFIKRWNS